MMQQFQEKLTTVQEKFQEQIQMDYIRMQNHQKQIQHDHNNLQRQMEAFFNRFAQIPTSFQPPSGQPEAAHIKCLTRNLIQTQSISLHNNTKYPTNCSNSKHCIPSLNKTPTHPPINIIKNKESKQISSHQNPIITTLSNHCKHGFISLTKEN